MGHNVGLVLLRSPVRYASLAPLAAVARYMRATSSPPRAPSRRCAPRAKQPLRATCARQAAVSRFPLERWSHPQAKLVARAPTYIVLLEGFITQKRSKLGKDSRIYSIFL